MISPSASITVYVDWAVTRKCRQTCPRSSLRWVTYGIWAASSPMDSVLSRPPTPTTATSPSYFWARSDTLTLWARQVGHQGAQNHSTAGRPSRLEPSNGEPSTVVAAKSRSAILPVPITSEPDAPAGDREDVPSALDNPAAPAFPAPLIDLDPLVSGGPPPDGIPPIDHPKFQPAAAVDWLAETDPVLSLTVGAESRAYPLEVMTWHEIVNDAVGG